MLQVVVSIHPLSCSWPPACLLSPQAGFCGARFCFSSQNVVTNISPYQRKICRHFVFLSALFTRRKREHSSSPPRFRFLYQRQSRPGFLHNRLTFSTMGISGSSRSRLASRPSCCSTWCDVVAFGSVLTHHWPISTSEHFFVMENSTRQPRTIACFVTPECVQHDGLGANLNRTLAATYGMCLGYVMREPRSRFSLKVARARRRGGVLPVPKWKTVQDKNGFTMRWK